MRKFLGRHRVLAGIELLGILLCVVLCFGPEKPVFSASASDIADRTRADGASSAYQSEEFSMSPGVYQLRAYGADHEGTGYLTVSARESTFQALRCDEVTVSARQRETAMEVYVVDKVDTAYVSYLYVGAPELPVENICLYHTSIGWRLMTFILLLAVTSINLLVWMREELRESRMQRDQEIAVWGLGLCVLLAYLPFVTDYYSNADLLFWFPILLHRFGFPLMDAYKLFVLAVLMGTAGIAYYSLYRCTGNRYGALLGSALYELAPYHLYILYNQGGVGEYLGMMFLPLVLCGMYCIYTGKKGKIPLIIGISGVLQSHILTCAMTLTVLVLAALVMWRKTFRKETLRELAEAALCCLLVNTWFWVPVLRMFFMDFDILGQSVSQNLQHVGTRLAGVLQIYPYVGEGQRDLYNSAPLQAGAAFGGLAVCYLLLRIWRRGQGRSKEANPYDKVMGGGLGLSLLCLIIPFSTCLVAMTTLFFSLTASFFVLWLEEERKVWTVQAGKALMTGCVLGVVMVALWSALYQVNDISYNMTPARLYTAAGLESAGVRSGEYLLAEMVFEETGYHNLVAGGISVLALLTCVGIAVRRRYVGKTGGGDE